MTQPEATKPAPIKYEMEQSVTVKAPTFSPYDQLLQKGRYIH
ncbi:hypothetical protein [Heyndrickxia sporothermodurans]